MNSRIDALEREVRLLRGIIMKGNTPSRQEFIKYVDFKSGVNMPRAYITSIADITLETVGDTSSSDQSSKINNNFNAIQTALTKKT